MGLSFVVFTVIVEYMLWSYYKVHFQDQTAYIWPGLRLPIYLATRQTTVCGMSLR